MKNYFEKLVACLKAPIVTSGSRDEKIFLNPSTLFSHPKPQPVLSAQVLYSQSGFRR